jgi:hypothetical protein
MRNLRGDIQNTEEVGNDYFCLIAEIKNRPGRDLREILTIYYMN